MAGRREPPPTAGGELFTKTSGRGSRKGGWLKLVQITFYGSMGAGCTTTTTTRHRHPAKRP